MDNITFTGRLNISGIRKDTARWKDVAKIFADKTKDYPKDKINLKLTYGRLSCDLFAREGAVQGFGSFTPVATEEILSLKNEQIADKLARLLEAYREEGRIRAIFNDLTKKLEKSDKANLDEQVFGNDYEKLYNLALDRAALGKNSILESDRVLEEFIEKY